MEIKKITGIFASNTPNIRRTSLVVVVFGLFLLAFLWIGLFFKIESERQVEFAAATRETGNFARVFEDHIVRTIRSADQMLLLLKNHYEKQGRDMDMAPFKKGGAFWNPAFLLMGIADEQGDWFISNQEPHVPSNLKDREHVKVHMTEDTGKIYISKPVIGRSSGKWSINITRRINKPDGSYGGVAIVGVNPYYFTGLYKQVDLGENSAISLIGLDGTVRARQSNDNEEVGQDVSQSALIMNTARTTVGSFVSESPIDSIKRIHSYRILQEYPLIVSVGMSEGEVYHSFNLRVQNYYIAALTSSLIILAFITILLLVIERQKRAEVALLQSHESLEYKVEERTHELYRVNQEVSYANSELQKINNELQKEIAERKRTENELRLKNKEIAVAYTNLQIAQLQAIHQEKMASIGQLAAGIAHEINNPLGFVISNFETLQKYVMRLLNLVTDCKALMNRTLLQEEEVSLRDLEKQFVELERQAKLDYILQDLEPIFTETNEGLQRVGDIVKALRLFSRVDQQGEKEAYDLNEGVKNSLIVARNEVKYVAKVDTDLSDIPAIQATGSQINQVILNLVLNSAYAIKAKDLSVLGTITVRTYADDQFVFCSVADDGTGIPEGVQKDIFNPFFTTKPVGQGTGLGLSISYDIIVNKHGGELTFTSEEGKGTTFVIKLPRSSISG